MSIASIGRKLLTACKYAALAIFAALWCWFTAIFGSFIGKGIGGSLSRKILARPSERLSVW